MRTILACLLALAVCGSARADVFVPSDPPPLSGASCVAGAGDVLAASAESDGVRVLLGGAWSLLDGLTGCPAVASAADGTAAITGAAFDTGDALLRVRVAGGAFGAPITLGPVREAPIVAVAPGGWAAAVWGVPDDTLVAAVVRPDGTLTRTVLDRGREKPFESVSGSAVAINASGDSTVIWQHSKGSTGLVRVARGTAGGVPATGADLPGDAQPSLALAPSGTELLAWSERNGLFASIDGGAPEVLDATSDGETMVPAAAEGAMLVAYTTAADEVVVADRVGSSWSQPRVIAAYNRRYSGYRDDEGRLALVGAVIAPDRRAAVMWARVEDGMEQVYGALGQVGGTWGAPQRLSAITRSAFTSGLGLDASGTPRAFWTEQGVGLRGATVAARPLDTTPPSVTVRFPSQVAPTRTGRFTARVRVRCSEACDARLTSATSEYREVEVALSVPAGRARTLRLQGADLADDLLRDPKTRRLRLRLVVTDRAGNLVRRTGTMRVPVIEKPIRALKVAPDHDFGMKTAAGNRLVVTLVNKVIDAAASRRPTEAALDRRFDHGRQEIRRAGHREVSSSRVLSNLYEALVIPLTRAGYDVDEIIGER